jgi:hypothetical protein
MKKVTISLFLLFALSMLHGCKGGGSSNSMSTVRLVNGTSSFSSFNGTISPLDIYWSGSGSASAIASGVPYGNASISLGISAGVSSIALASSGSSPSSGTPYSFSGGYSYTMLAYQTYPSGPSTPSLQVAQLIDNQTAPVSGDGLIGVADYSGAGSLDVYMVLSGTSPSFAWASGISGLTKYSTVPVPVPPGNASYHIRVTGAGAGYGNDVRLDIPSVIIGNQQVLTLVLTPTIGGGLVDGLLVLQQGETPLTAQQTVTSTAQQTVTSYKNGSARVRIAGNFTTNGIISSATIKTNANGSPILGSDLTSPNVSSYMVVPLNGGTQATPQLPNVAASQLPLAITITVNGVLVPGVTTTATPGADLTLLAVGSVASPTYYLLNDDNTLSTSGSAKLRLVNGINNLTGSISLNYGGLYPQNAAFGAASTATNVPIPGGSPNTLAVSFVGTNYGGTVPSLGAPALQPQGVYSVFMLGDTSAASGVLSTDHLYQEH